MKQNSFLPSESRGRMTHQRPDSSRSSLHSLNLADDSGHTFIVGPSRAGKSLSISETLMLLLGKRWKRNTYTRSTAPGKEKR
jgi:hypothetical protein